jgi:hypothetical protein
MKSYIVKAFILFLLSGIIYAEETPTFKKQIIQVPMNTVDWVGPYWKDINKDGLIDLLVLVQKEKKVFTYVQGSSGFPETPTQTITLPPATMWIALLDVNEHPGDEMLISTSEGLVYYCQNNGVFEIKPEKLIEAEQIVPRNHPPIIIDPNKWLEGSKNTIPIIFSDHSVIYKVNESYQLKTIGTIEHEFKKSIDKYNWNSWNIGSKKSEQLRIRTVAQKKTETDKEEEPKKENEYIEKTLAKIKEESRSWRDHNIEKNDINADGREDVVLWHSVGEIDLKTTVIVFIRKENGDLSEKPNHVLRYSGIPINILYPQESASLFYDIDNDGTLEIVLIDLKRKPISVDSFIDMAVDKGLDWVLSIRRFDESEGYPKKADCQLDITTSISPNVWIDDLVTFDGDFNNDGLKDLIVKRTDTQCDIYLSSSNSKFYDPQPKLQLQIPSEGRVFVEDLNGDGISDIYVIDYEKGQITLFLSEPLKKKGAFSESR